MRNYTNGPEYPAKTLTSREIASWLRVSTETIARLRRRGLLPARKVGKSYRFFAHEVLAALPVSGQGVLAPGNSRRSALEDVLRSLGTRAGDQT